MARLQVEMDCGLKERVLRSSGRQTLGRKLKQKTFIAMTSWGNDEEGGQEYLRKVVKSLSHSYKLKSWEEWRGFNRKRSFLLWSTEKVPVAKSANSVVKMAQDGASLCLSTDGVNWKKLSLRSSTVCWTLLLWCSKRLSLSCPPYNSPALSKGE